MVQILMLSWKTCLETMLCIRRLGSKGLNYPNFKRRSLSLAPTPFFHNIVNKEAVETASLCTTYVADGVETMFVLAAFLAKHFG